MQKVILFILFIPTLFLGQQKITLEDIWVKYAFLPKSAEGFNVMNDGLHYVDIEELAGQKVLCQYEIKSGKKSGRKSMFLQPRLRYTSSSFSITPQKVALFTIDFSYHLAENLGYLKLFKNY